MIHIDGTLLKRMVQATAYAAATDDSRPVLAGVNVSQNADGVLTLQATDGFRLAVVEGMARYDGPEPPVSFIVPARTLTEIAKKIPKKGGTMQIAVTEAARKVEVYNEKTKRMEKTDEDQTHTQGVTFSGCVPTTTTRVIEGNFPDVRGLIPKAESAKTTVCLPREATLRILKTAHLFARENNDIVRLDAHAFPNGNDLSPLLISARASEVGSYTGDVWGAATSGAGGVIAFNCDYLHDVFANSDAEEIHLLLQGPNNAGTFLPMAEGLAVSNVIMPMHLAQ